MFHTTKSTNSLCESLKNKAAITGYSYCFHTWGTKCANKQTIRTKYTHFVDAWRTHLNDTHRWTGYLRHICNKKLMCIYAYRTWNA